MINTKQYRHKLDILIGTNNLSNIYNSFDKYPNFNSSVSINYKVQNINTIMTVINSNVVKYYNNEKITSISKPNFKEITFDNQVLNVINSNKYSAITVEGEPNRIFILNLSHE